MTKDFVDGICESVVKEHGETPDITEITVNDMDIRSCKGCFACWRGNGKCCINDDVAEILQMRVNADIIIWSFPLYCYGVPGKLKTLIDRQIPMVLPFITSREDGVSDSRHPERYESKEQRQVLVSTCGFYTAEKDYSAVTSMFDLLDGVDGYETVFCGQGELFHVEDPYVQQLTSKYLNVVKRAGSEYASGKIEDSTSQELKQPPLPRKVFEKMANSSW